MSKIFIFGIGGTGSRVLRSLTMMLASGVKFGADAIVPVIIDPDNANADMTRTVALLNNYASVNSQLNFSPENTSQFFRTRVDKILPNYTLLVRDTDDRSFREFISYADMSRENQAMMQMLFSDKNLSSSMEVGFKGNPNIGSVVLNQIAHSNDFQNFANAFSEGDKIFIISSIFGGTGASGFPLLLKTLRNGNDFANFNLINNASIGAVTVLPYFRLKPSEDSEIDSSTFISKAKSALSYYEKNIIRNGIIDALYYLADDVSNVYDNHEGGSLQQNDAHLIEFLAASAIVDFSNSYFDAPANMELGIKDTEGAVTFNSFYFQMTQALYNPLVQFTLMSNALTYKESTYTSPNFSANAGNFNDLYSSDFYKSLTNFLKRYKEWLNELKSNRRPLDLFNMECGDKPFDLVTDVKPKPWHLQRLSNYDLFTERLNLAVKECKSNQPKDKFLEMFYLATSKIISKKLSK